MRNESDAYVYQGITFQSKEAMEMFIASRQPQKAESKRAPIWLWVIGVAVALFGISTCTSSGSGGDRRAAQSASGSQGSSEFAQKYPGSWMDGVNVSIIRSLVKHGALNCGEVYYRPAAGGTSEYLVYCTSDGKNWSAYLVWPSIDQVMGPYKPSSDIPLPR